MDFSFAPRPNEEAAGIIRDKEPVVRKVFDGLLPELRGRAFTVTSVRDLDVMRTVRDRIAELPRGARWEDVKGDVAAALEPDLGEGATQRAEILMRVHGFQAFQASNWRTMQEDGDTTHIQYLATEDTHVRDSHLALNGIILPKDDSFWNTHTPPWEWGCRCRLRGINPDLLDEAKVEDESRAPESKLVMEGPAAEQLRNGTLVREDGTYHVNPPIEQGRDKVPFEWHPDDLRLPIGDVLQRYDPKDAEAFVERAKNTTVLPGETLWNWLMSKPAKRERETTKRQDRQARQKRNA